MENNISLTRQFREEQFHRIGSSSGDNLEENFQEFKHSVLLHERGLEMQDSDDVKTKSSKTKTANSKHKSGFHLNQIHSANRINEDFEEEKELRVRFAQRHI